MDNNVDKTGGGLNNKILGGLNRTGWDFSIAKNGFKDGWVVRSDPLLGRWLHSDIKDVAYRYNHKVYDKIVDDSQLKQNP